MITELQLLASQKFEVLSKRVYDLGDGSALITDMGNFFIEFASTLGSAHANCVGMSIKV